MKKIKENLKKFLPTMGLLVAGGAITYGGVFTVQKLPTVITSGSQVVFQQPCLEKGVDKDGKEICNKLGPVTIFALGAK